MKKITLISILFLIIWSGILSADIKSTDFISLSTKNSDLEVDKKSEITHIILREEGVNSEVFKNMKADANTQFSNVETIQSLKNKFSEVDFIPAPVVLISAIEKNYKEFFEITMAIKSGDLGSVAGLESVNNNRVSTQLELSKNTTIYIKRVSGNTVDWMAVRFKFKSFFVGETELFNGKQGTYGEKALAFR